MIFFYIVNFQGGKSARVVNCILALKSYSDWKQSGGIGTWKYGGNLKLSTSGGGKPFMRKNSEPFMNSFSRACSGDPSSFDEHFSDLSEAVSGLFKKINKLFYDFRKASCNYKFICLCRVPLVP